jgi:hypothetical protein
MRDRLSPEAREVMSLAPAESEQFGHGSGPAALRA